MKRFFPERSLNAIKTSIEAMATNNPAFRNKLTANPEETVQQEVGTTLANKKIKIIEEATDEIIIVLRNSADSLGIDEIIAGTSPSNGEISADSLEAIAGGINAEYNMPNSQQKTGFVITKKLSPGFFTNQND